MERGRLSCLHKGRGGCTALLAGGLSYDGSRVLKAKSLKELYAKAEAATRCDWWVTMNGSHVLIKGDKIVGGAGGKLNGKTMGTQFTKGAKSRWLKGGKENRGEALYGVDRGSQREFTQMTRRLKQLRPEFLKVESLDKLVAPLSVAGFSRTDLLSDSFKTLDKKLALDNINRVLELEGRFHVAKTLGGVEFSAVNISGDAGNTTAAYVKAELRHAEPLELSLNRSFYAKGAKLPTKMKAKIKEGWFMPCDARDASVYIATHEYGHLLQAAVYRAEMKKRGWKESDRYALGDSDRYFELRYRTQSRCLKEIEAIGKRKDPGFKLVDHLSKYGQTNYAEAFAEIFANSQCGKPNAAGDAMSVWLREKGFLEG